MLLNWIFQKFAMEITTDIDECSLDPAICGKEAGCYNVHGSYHCICSHSLQPMDPIRGCPKNDSVDHTSLTENPLEYNELLKMLSNARTPTENTTNGVRGRAENTTSFSYRSAISSESLSTILLVSLSLFFLATVTLVGLTLCWRRRRHYPWINSCLSRKHRAEKYAGSLIKCRQQYITNPNYYSSSPDGPSLQNLRDMEISKENLTFLNVIGEGCFGKVHKGVYVSRDGTDQHVAIKILKEGTSPEIQADFEREVEIISSFNHENILKLIGIVIKETERIPWMVFEYMKYGDLAELLRNSNPILPRSNEVQIFHLKNSDLLNIAIQVANGMAYLSSQHFVHRDLATRNCLVGDNLIVKISDFGMTRDIYTSDYYKVGGSRMLPIRWMAPESIMFGKFSLESDVWSYGVVLWEIYTYGKQPYYGHSNEQVVELIIQGILLKPPEECTPVVCSIMAGCWKTEPKDRLCFQDIYNNLLRNVPLKGKQMLSVSEQRESENSICNYIFPIVTNKSECRSNYNLPSISSSSIDRNQDERQKGTAVLYLNHQANSSTGLLDDSEVQLEECNYLVPNFPPVTVV